MMSESRNEDVVGESATGLRTNSDNSGRQRLINEIMNLKEELTRLQSENELLLEAITTEEAADGYFFSMAGDYKPNYIKKEEWRNTGTKEIMVFHPTLEEMNDFPAYIQKCEDLGAAEASGICKIVPPPEWNPRPNRAQDYNDMLQHKIYTPVKEVIEKLTHRGAYIKHNHVFRKEMTVQQFREKALSHKYSNPKPESPIQDIERHYWRNITFGEPIYGADTPGTCFEESVKEFNVGNLGTIMDVMKEEGIEIPGVTSTYLYFGMYKATFAWHVEDCDLYSINYLHYGEPKFWYAVPPSEAKRMEELLQSRFPEEFYHCNAWLRHKTSVMSPSELKASRIPYGTMVQYPGEFIITFPRGYHTGFNLGYNCAESTNFAMDRWIDFGKNATICRCADGSVELDMRPFMRRFRPDEYEEWHNFWYGERTVIKRVTPDPEEECSGLPIVDLPPIKKAVLDSFVDQMVEARNDFNFLWHHQTDFKEECQFNKAQGRFFPHCCICQYFVPQNDKEAKLEARSESIRYTSDRLYEKTDPEKTKMDFKESRLIQCRRCFVVVHVDCLNLGNVDLDTSNESESTTPDASPPKKRRMNWTCKRCEFAREELICASINCIFCPLRGGVLIPHDPENTIGQFVHVICAMMSRRTKIIRSDNSIYAKSLSKEWLTELNRAVPPWQELNLNKNYLISDIDMFLNKGGTGTVKCTFCRRAIEDQFIRCQHCYDLDEQPLFFHPFCAYFARVVLEQRDFPTLIVGVCPCHQHSEDTKDKLKVGEKVIFQSQDKIDYVRVQSQTTSDYLHVEFFDSTFSQDVSPSDVVDCECKRIGCNGKHVPGWIVTVRWEDSSVFQGYVRQMKTDSTYVVESTKTKETFVCSRKPLWRNDQEIPENVADVIQDRLSSRT